MRVPLILAAGTVILIAGVVVWFGLQPAPPPPAAPVDTAPVLTEPVEPAPAPAPVEPEPDARPVPRPPRPAPPPPEPEPVEAAPTTATLRIETDVPGATVFLDRIGVGEAPLTIPNVAPGSHRLNVSAPGYDGYGENIDIEPGPRTITVSFKEIRLDTQARVVHKHGIGSCEGLLSASPQGVRYVADEGDDSFSVPLADIDTFEVDYLGKNVKLKIRNGRTYNFTGPDGNADQLFVFHEAVDKVLKRLATGN